MKKTLPIYVFGMFTGMGIAIAVIAGVSASRAADTTAVSSQKTAIRNPVNFQIQTGIVADGEQVPVPVDADTSAIHIFLSIREIQDNNEILGRLECHLEPDGRTARVRNVNKFSGEVVATGTANYVVFYERW